MKTSDYIVKFFEEKGIKVVFGYIGGAITHLVDSIDKNSSVEYIQTYHEQSAAFAAEGYARAQKTLGVAIATSGPGATNLITGIADAFCDNVPVLYITGQVNSYEGKKDKPIRQQGFQELEIIGVVKSITKYAKYIGNALEIPYELEKAYQLAMEGRQGPVLLDIPMDIQRAEIDIEECLKYSRNGLEEKQSIVLKIEIKKIIFESKKPIILIGGASEFLTVSAKKKLKLILEKSQIPVICSLMGKGKISEEKINFLGMVGSYGNRSSNLSMKYCDLLIALGSRLDTRQTGAKIDSFLENGKIIHVDIDQNELESHRLKNKVNVCIEIKNYAENKEPYHMMLKLNEFSEPNDYFVTDIGQNQMWAAQTIKISEKQNFYTGGGLASMGFSIPFAIGLAFGGKTRIISISGDGGFHMSTQSLMLISQYSLPIKVLVMNNSSLGMITQFQGLYFNNNLVGTTSKKGYVVPDIQKIAEAYNLKYYMIKEKDLSDSILMKEIFSDELPCIIEYVINTPTVVTPKLEFDSPIYNPSPKIEYNEILD
ncbi:MAG: thiamine pyrophosphate-binding protein [Fusobacteria bacterium]|nr:thiamine pyrophosphate-binding protein [Fusobacteriota bacterium]